MQTPVKKLSIFLAGFTGIMLVFIGIRFLVSPQAGETGFGIDVAEGGNFSFHYIKGIRDLTFGLLMLVLLLCREYRALGMLSLVSAVIPATDFMIVWSAPAHHTGSLIPHLIAVVLCIVMGFLFLKTDKKIVHAV